jgi:AraC-like DNA-binding protein
MISRSLLDRKINSISGITTTDFVHLMRLTKAVELIKTENYPLSEVAYLVGFNCRDYFTRCFKKVYDKAPTEYLTEYFEQHRK